MRPPRDGAALARSFLLSVLVVAMAAAGCESGGVTPATEPVTRPVVPSGATVDPGTPGNLSPGQSRARRRMNIDQLDAAIRRATGDIGWDVNGQNQFTRFGPSLGKPDFLLRTREVLDPSPVFQKFLDDAARSVCARLVVEERGRPAEARVLFVKVPPGRKDPSGVTPQAVDDNLRAVLLRFHGRKLAADAPDLTGWRWLYQSALTVSGDAEKAWQTVCVGAITHPDFYSY